MAGRYGWTMSKSLSIVNRTALTVCVRACYSAPMMSLYRASFACVLIAACGPGARDDVAALPDAAVSPVHGSDGGSGGSNDPCGEVSNCYSIYAHSDKELYVVDVQSKSLITVGAFNAPNAETITDLAVAPDNTIYVMSETNLYTASPADGHVTKLGSLSACGTKAVALTTTPDGMLWTGDYKGKLCRIDTTQTPPVVSAPITMSSGIALTGDFAAVGDGTVFGTAYLMSDAANTGTQANNLLVKIDVATGVVTRIGPTGFPKLFGVAFAVGKVFGFTHDGTGRVVTIDPHTGAGTLFATFTDAANTGISFGGAGVNSMVPVIQ